MLVPPTKPTDASSRYRRLLQCVQINVDAEHTQIVTFRSVRLLSSC